MTIVSAFLITWATATSLDSQQSFYHLIHQFDSHLEWIDEKGSRIQTDDQAKASIYDILQKLSQPSISIRHESEWKNDKCFRIFHLSKAEAEGYRLFFQCKKGKNQEAVVTRIKVNKI